MLAWVVSALGRALLHAAWQGIVIGLTVELGDRLLRDRDPRVRHVLGLGGLFSALVAFVGTFILGLGRPAPVLGVNPLGMVSPDSRWPWELVVVGAWLVGAAGLGLRLGWSALAIRRMRRTAGAVPPALAQRGRDLAGALGIRRPVSFGVSATITAPAVIGLWRPLVLLPVAAVAQTPAAYLEAALLHELAHVRRLDPLALLLQRVTETLLFFHPATWRISALVSRTREMCCDDEVRRHLDQPVTYARALLHFEELRAHRGAPALASTGGDLMERVQRIVSNRGPGPARRAGLAPLFILALGLGSSLALGPACNPVAQPDSEARGEPVESEPEREAEPADPVTPLAVDWLPESVSRYTPEIEAAAARHGVDPALVAIVVLVESGGNPGAESGGGALGLMQLMPATAQAVAQEQGHREHGVERLRDPAYNIDLGTAYLARQLDRFGDAAPDEAVWLAAAAYNAGPGRVDAVRRGEADLPDETQRYVDRVVALWGERDRPQSATLDRAKSKP